MTITLVAFLAGLASVLTPCVLPLLPALLTVSGSGGRRTVVGLVVGIVASFSLALLVVTAFVSAVGTIGDTTRWIAVGLLVAIGVLVLVPPWKERVEGLASRFAGRVAPGSGSGFGGGLLTGLALGVVWTPCAGPILAGVSAAAATQEVGVRTVVNLGAFAVGMAIPLMVIALGGRRGSLWLRDRVGGRKLDVATGVVLLGTAGLIGLGLDTQVNRWVAENTPFASSITEGLESQVLAAEAPTSADSSLAERLSPLALGHSGYPQFAGLQDLGPAPELEGLGPWFNTPTGDPLAPADLRGKVVLVDFWTYSCVNCIRTLPYLRDWHDTYADEGLVVLGLHAPEFAFEAQPDNVEQAIADLDVAWPVALDNDFTTWRNYYNRYWPAKYLIDRDGTLRYAHYGEGDYEQTERHIVDLLDADPALLGAPTEDPARTEGQTPETYLGADRGERFAGSVVGSDESYLADRPAAYEAAGALARHTWTLAGTWTIEGERSVAGADATLAIRYYGRDVFLVMADTAPRTREAAPTVVSTDTGAGGQEMEHTIDSQRLYVLRDTDDPQEGTMRLRVPEGVAVYAFTFG